MKSCRCSASGFAAGYAAGLAEAHRQDDGDGPSGYSWEQIVRHAESHPGALSVWERELIDSASCALHFGTALTPRHKQKLLWILHNRFNGKFN